MFWAFASRRPWAAALVTLIFNPLVGMLYLGRAGWAFAYLGVQFGAAMAALALAPGMLARQQLPLLMDMVLLPVNAIGAVHAFLAARGCQATDRRWYSRWYWLVAFWAVFPLAALGIRTFLFQAFYSPSASMLPTVAAGDHFFVSKHAYNGQGPRRGDVVVFYVPSLHTDFVKRVMAIPGDRIVMVNGVPVINGVPLLRRRTGDYARPCRTGRCPTPQYEEVLLDGRRHREIELTPDGPLDDTDLFTVPKDSYFVMGDNRDNSNDSRSGLGFIPRGQIVGRVEFKYLTDGHWTWQRVP